MRITNKFVKVLIARGLQCTADRQNEAGKAKQKQRKFPLELQ